MRDTILEILEELRPDVDFEKETKLIDDKILVFALSKSKCCLELSQTYRSASVACKAIELV